MPNSASLFFVVLDFKTKAKTTSFNIYQYKKKHRPSLNRVWLSGPGPGSIGFHQANSKTGFCLHPDRSQARVGRVPGRPTGPGRVLKHWFFHSFIFSFLASPSIFFFITTFQFIFPLYLVPFTFNYNFFILISL